MQLNGQNNSFVVVGSILNTNNPEKLEEKYSSLGKQQSSSFNNEKKRKLSTLSLFRDAIDLTEDWKKYHDWKINKEHSCRKYGGSCHTSCSKIGNSWEQIGICKEGGKHCCYEVRGEKTSNPKVENAVQCHLHNGLCVHNFGYRYRLLRKMICNNLKLRVRMCKKENTRYRIRYAGSCDKRRRCLINEKHHLLHFAEQNFNEFGANSDEACRLIGGLCTLPKNQVDTYIKKYKNQKSTLGNSFMLGNFGEKTEIEDKAHVLRSYFPCQGLIEKKEIKKNSLNSSTLRICRFLDERKFIKLPYCGSDQQTNEQSQFDLSAPCKCINTDLKYHYRSRFVMQNSMAFYQCGAIKSMNPYFDIPVDGRTIDHKMKLGINFHLYPTGHAICNGFVNFAHRITKLKLYFPFEEKPTFNWLNVPTAEPDFDKRLDKSITTCQNFLQARYKSRRRLLAFVRAKLGNSDNSNNVVIRQGKYKCHTHCGDD
jgi:hypothetical protein